jgi:hypothetical protein
MGCDPPRSFSGGIVRHVIAGAGIAGAGSADVETGGVVIESTGAEVLAGATDQRSGTTGTVVDEVVI